MEPLRLPELCARCGVQPGVVKHTVKIEKSTWLDMLLFVVLAVGQTVRIRYNSYTFDVLVCPDCKARLTRIEKTNKVAAGGSMLAMLAAFAAILVFTSMGEEALIQNLGWIGLVFVGALITFMVFPIVNRIRIGTYDGKYFKFANPQFHAEFSTLNPHRVKPKVSAAPKNTKS